jgi:GT2 family glycosyltransferase
MVNNLDVTAVCVNFRTPEQFETAVTTFRRCYPDIPMILIDNAGCERSADVLQDLAVGVSNIEPIWNERNVGHGPALHQAAQMAETRFLFTLDSDTRTEGCGFVEQMLKMFEKDKKLLATGCLRHTNRNGVEWSKHEGRTHPYIHPYAAIYDLEWYFQFTPFVHRGAPAVQLCHDAEAAGLHFKAFPINEYVWHREAGTRGWFGGAWDPATDRRRDREWEYRQI